MAEASPRCGGNLLANCSSGIGPPTGAGGSPKASNSSTALLLVRQVSNASVVLVAVGKTHSLEGGQATAGRDGATRSASEDRLSRRRPGCRITIAWPLSTKMELGLKIEPPHAANDNQPRRKPSGSRPAAAHTGRRTSAMKQPNASRRPSGGGAANGSQWMTRLSCGFRTVGGSPTHLYDAPVAGDPHLHVTICGMSRGGGIPTRKVTADPAGRESPLSDSDSRSLHRHPDGNQDQGLDGWCGPMDDIWTAGVASCAWTLLGPTHTASVDFGGAAVDFTGC